jgi:anti-sigma factor ChrR (cupin superfamily)
MSMKKFAVAVVVVAFACAAIVVRAEDPKESNVLHVSSKSGKWVDGPAPGVQMIPIRGDMKTGPYAVFIKFSPGSDHGWHTHTNDISILVVSGSYLYKDESGMDKRVGPGEYFSIRGGHKHWSGGDAKEGCVFLNEGTAKFDLNKVEAPK